MQDKKLSRKHIDFIINQKKQGKTYSQITLDFGKKFGIVKSSKAIEQTFQRYKHEYDLTTVKSVVEVKTEVLKDKIITQFLDLVEERQYIPILAELIKDTDISPETLRRHFQNMEGLVAAAKLADPKVFENIIDESLFNNQSFKDLQQFVSNHKRFIITSAVTGAEPHPDALKAIETYCKHNDAALLILPCSDPARQGDAKSKWSLSSKLPKESIVFKDLALNHNLILSTIKMSAKQLQPLTGLRRISQKRGSTIVASPKQFLEFSANSNNNEEIPRALMSTGAITKANYRKTTEMYMSERTAYLAEQDHTLGAVIVEIKNGKIFFFRHIQFESKTGAFCDLDKKYLANGKVEKNTVALIQTGDWHVLSTDPTVKRLTKDLVNQLNPVYITVEDFFDGISINPHEKHNTISLAKKAKNNMLSLEEELKACQKELNDICGWSKANIVLKYGNHEDFLKRWLSSGDFIFDPTNKIIGMKLSLAYEELGIMPFEYAMRQLFEVDNQDQLRFLGVNESFKVSGIENGAHGHLGKGGRRNPTMSEIEECYGASNVGHNHSAAIFRSAFRAGTSSKLKLSYNDGPSAWTQSHVIQHQNGTRQLISFIYGEYQLKD